MWIEWLKSEWNNPSRTDSYLMQLAAETRRSMSSNPGSIKMDQFKIEFTFKDRNKDNEQPVSEEFLAMQTAVSKAKWIGLAGKPPVVVSV